MTGLSRSMYRLVFWRLILWRRSVREYVQRFRAWNVDGSRRLPYVVYMTGMPRTGTSFMKNFLGDYPGLCVRKFEPRGFYISWQAALHANSDVFVDKSTHYIRHLNNIRKACGRHTPVCVVVRDPRDQLSSLFEFDRHPELPRNKRFWRRWVKQYSDLLEFSRKFPEQPILLVRYEDLVRYPIEAKEYFLKWTGVMRDN